MIKPIEYPTISFPTFPTKQKLTDPLPPREPIEDGSLRTTYPTLTTTTVSTNPRLSFYA